MSENRKYRRLPIEPLPARVFQEGKLIDLSIGGAFMMSRKPLPRGATLEIEIPLPGERTVHATSVVEWSGDYFGGKDAQRCTGMGLRFVSIDPADRIAITRFLTRRYKEGHASVRVRTKLPARVDDEGTGKWVAGSVREIGEQALFIETAATVPIGTEIDILIRFPNFRAPIAARGVVRATVGPDGVIGDEEATPVVPLEPLDGARGLMVELREVTPRGREVMNVFLDESRAEPTPPGE